MMTGVLTLLPPGTCVRLLGILVFFPSDDRRAITAVHSNQDHIWLAKIGDYIGFYVDRRS